MSTLNIHQKNIINSMVKLTEQYLDSKITYANLVSSLEGAIDASEINDKELIDKFYEYWTPLEIMNSEQEIDIADEDKKLAVQKMKDFLITLKSINNSQNNY